MAIVFFIKINVKMCIDGKTESSAFFYCSNVEEYLFVVRLILYDML